MQTTSFIGSGVCENEPLCIPGLAGWMPMETDMAITRRALLATVPAIGVAAALPAKATASGPSALDLIEAHKEALRISDAKWSAVGEIEEASPRIPCPKVQWGRTRLVGLNDDGTANYEPLYAYQEDDLDDLLRPTLEANLGMCGNHEASRQKVISRHQERLEGFKADLRQQKVAEAAAELAYGITAATDAAKAASDVVRSRLDAIMHYPYETVSDFRVAAAYILECYDNSTEGFEDETPAKFLAAVVGGQS
jgi:hypothetical protein